MLPCPPSERSFEPALALLRAGIPGLVAVYLFGSASRGGQHDASDVDLAVLAPHSLGAVARWALQERIADVLHRDVDLVDLRTASTVMRAEVLDGSRLLYDGDATARQFFEAYALSAYALLNEERAAILADIHRRGSVYGR